MSDYSLTKYLTAINYSKEKLLDTDDRDWEKKYPPFIINKGLSYFSDTVMYANEMNRLHHASKHMQFSFFLNSIKSRKRFSKWLKAHDDEKIDIICEYFGYSRSVAKSVSDLFDKQTIDILKKRLDKGGSYRK
jgi:hypothetical protein